MNKIIKILVLIMIIVAANSFVVMSASAQEAGTPAAENPSQGADTGALDTGDNKDGNKDTNEPGNGESTGGTEGDTMSLTATSELTTENLPPTVDAGSDQTITLPTDSVNLNGTATDSDGTIASYVWSQVSGPSDVNPEDVEDPTASSLVAGTYVFKLLVTDDNGANADDQVTITVNPAGPNSFCANGTLTPQEFDQAKTSGAIVFSWHSISINDGQTQGTFTITNTTGCIMPVSLSSYKMYVEPGSPGWLSTQVLFDKEVSENANASVAITVDLPTACRAQIDAWYGVAPTELLDSNPYNYPSVPFVLAAAYSTQPLCQPPTDFCVDGVTLTLQEFQAATTAGKIIWSNEIHPATGATEATWTIINNTGCILPLSLSVYKMYDASKLSTQVWFDEDNSNNADQTVTLTVKLPGCRAQIDGWFGADAPDSLPDDSNPYGNPSRYPLPVVIAYGYGHDADWTLCGNDITDVCPNIEGIQTEIPEGMEKNSEGNCVDEDNGGGGSSSGSRRRSAPRGEVLGEEIIAPVVPQVLGLPTTGVGDSEMNIMILALSGIITAMGLISLAWPQRSVQTTDSEDLGESRELSTTSVVGFSNVFSNLNVYKFSHDNSSNISYPVYSLASEKLLG